MEKKEPIKISLSTFFLIIAIIVIFVMGYFLLNTLNEKNNSEEKVSDLNSQVGELQEKINNIVENTNTTDTKNNVNNGDFSENEIKQALTNYLNIFKGHATPEGLLKKLGLLKDGEYTNANLTDDNYIKTNIKYTDFKKKVLNYVTEGVFNSVCYNKKSELLEFKEKDGLLYYSNSGMTGTEYEVKSIRVKGDYKDMEYIADVYTINLDDSKDLNSIEFHIKNVNGRCVISYCD